jgi:hypothetical protein
MGQQAAGNMGLGGGLDAMSLLQQGGGMQLAAQAQQAAAVAAAQQQQQQQQHWSNVLRQAAGFEVAAAVALQAAKNDLMEHVPGVMLHLQYPNPPSLPKTAVCLTLAGQWGNSKMCIVCIQRVLQPLGMAPSL